MEDIKRVERDTVEQGISGADQRGELDKALKPEPVKEVFSCEIVSNVVPRRGIQWHIIFTVIFLSISTLVIYFSDWALLFFVVVASGFSLWRGHEGRKMKFSVTTEGIKINERKIDFDSIDNYYFGRFGENATINIYLVKKYIPHLTYILIDHNNVEKIRHLLEDNVPETEPREENLSDFVIRKLKI